jgi:hypothetical protein
MGQPRSVGDIMRREFVSLQASDHLDFVEDVMSLGRIRHLPVLENGKLVGIVSHRDLLANSLSRAIDFDAKDRRTFLRSVDVSEAMARNVITVQRETPIDRPSLMLRHRVGCCRRERGRAPTGPRRDRPDPRRSSREKPGSRLARSSNATKGGTLYFASWPTETTRGCE